MSREYKWADVGKRLKLLRLAKGVKHQKPFADLLGASEGQYSHWERGWQIIPVEYAAKFSSLTGATLDYIYLGNSSAIPINLLSELKKLSETLPGSEND
jgi:transcriptional regulator with XRE-family HTH domain